MVNGKPVWTFSPNWGAGVRERLEWLTDILSSVSGAEQRRSMRMSPRREFETSYYLTDRERAHFDIATFMAGGADWYMPLWPEVVRLDASLAAGSTTVPIDPANREFRVNDYILFIKDAFTYETVQVVDITGGVLKLISPTVSTWGRGTRVYPLRLARFREQPQFTKHTDRFIEFTATMRLAEVDSAPAAPTVTTYAGHPVILARPDESEDLNHAYQRKMLELDGQVGLPKFTDQASRAWTSQQYRWVHANRAAYAEFRRFLYSLRGRWKSFWAPTFMQDMTPSRDLTSGDAFLHIQKIGYTDYGGAVAGRKNIRIELLDGTRLYREISGSINVGADEEKINLTETFGSTIVKENIRSISYLCLSRLESDTVEIQHETDADGLNLCTVTFQSAPDFRDAALWDVPAIMTFSGSPTGCMPPCAPPSIQRQDDMLLEGGGYNPLLQEIWASSAEEVPPFNQMGYRFNAATLEQTGVITVDNPDIPTFEYFMGTYTYPTNYVPDYANRLMWSVAQVRVSGVGRYYLFKFDMETGETLGAKWLTGAGFFGSDVEVHCHYDSGSVWLTSPYSGSIYAHQIDPETMIVLGSYSNAHNFSDAKIDRRGNIYYIRNAVAPNNGQVWKFNTTTHSFTQVHNNTDNPPYMLLMDTNRDVMYILNNFFLVATAIQVFDTAADALTGQNLPQPRFEGGGNCRFDGLNNVLWGVTWGSAPFGKFNGIKVSDGTAFGEFEPSLMGFDDDIGEFTNASVVPQATPLGNSPNALYSQTGRFWDSPTNTDYGYGLAKVPMCNLYHAGDPLPEIPYGMVYEEGRSDDIAIRVPRCPFSFKFFGRDLNSNTIPFFVGSNSYFNTDRAVTGFSYASLKQPNTWKVGYEGAAAVVIGGADRSVFTVSATVESGVYKIRFEGGYNTSATSANIFWELKFYPDGTFTLWTDATAGTPSTSFYTFATTAWALMSGTSSATSPATYGGGFEADYEIPIVQNKTFRFTRGDADGNTWKCEQID